MRQFWAVAPSVLLSTTALTTAALAQDVDEIIVRGANIPDEKRATSEISSILDETKFERQGDGDIAASLRRVAGLSLAQDKFVIVRGLNERYSSATLNGSPLPSPEPLRRVAPLDLFPTSILSGALVQKTFSPEYSGEFGGGAIDLRTKAVPDEFFFEISGDFGVNTESTFVDGLLYEGGDNDWTGFDDGTRNIPAPLSALFNSGQSVTDSSVSAQDQQAIAQSFENFDTLVLQRGDAGPNFGVRASYGDRFDLSNAVTMGVIASVGYGNEWEGREGIRNDRIVPDSGTATGLRADRQATFESMENKISLNALGSLGFEILDNHEVKLTGLMVRKTSKEASSTTRLRDGDTDRIVRVDASQWIERQLWTGQLQGEHVFPDLSDLEVTWRTSYSEATRDAPYDRRTSYIINGSDTDVDPETGLGFIVDPGTIPLVSGRDPSASIDFSKIEDTYQDAGLDFKLPLFFGDREIVLKAGYAYTDNERESLNRQYFYTGFSTIANQCNDTRLNGGDAAQRIDRLLDDAFLSSDTCGSTPPIRIDQTPNNTDFPGETLGTLQVHAGYFGLDAQVNDFVRTALGVRFEDGEQTSETIFFDSVSDSRVVFSAPVIEEEYFLPAATVTWNFADNLQLRVGYSETITRPQFREKSPNIFLNTETERSFVGNPFLENAEIKNYDARLEWYFGREEFITLGAFYKDLENPIEEIGRSVANESDVTTFINTPQAELYGAEFEFEKRFELYDFAQRFAEGSALSEWTSSKDLYFAVNYTYTSSEVQAGSEPVNLAAPLATGLGFVPLEISAENLIQDGRALQGQSDHLLNIQFGYEDLDVNSKATLLLNYASERIREAGTLLVGADTPDVIEEPPLTLDFVYTRGFEVWGGEYEVGFKAQNILGEEYKAFSEGRGEVPVEEYDLGQTFAISLKRKF